MTNRKTNRKTNNKTNRKTNRKTNNKTNKTIEVKEFLIYDGGANYKKSQELRKQNLKDSKGLLTPSYEIIKGDGYPYVRFSFEDENEKLLASQGTFFMKTKNITFRSRMANGFKKAMSRFFSGENFFLNEYKLKDKPTNKEYLQLSIDNPGQVMVKILEPGESYYISPRNFLACSRNLKVSAKVQVSRIVDGQLLMTSFINETDKPGHIFIQAYVSIEEKRLKKGEEIQIDNSHVLSYDKHSKIQISKISNLRGFIFGGEGLTYKFNLKDDANESVIYVQTHSFKKHARNICKYCSLISGNIPKNYSKNNSE